MDGILPFPILSTLFQGLETLKGKSKNLRILEMEPRSVGGKALRQVSGGWLYQDEDNLTKDINSFVCQTGKSYSAYCYLIVKFAQVCCDYPYATTHRLVN